MVTKAQLNSDERRWNAAAEFVQAGSELKRLLADHTLSMASPTLRDAQERYRKALKVVNKYRYKGERTGE